jgi:hypothetical protein
LFTACVEWPQRMREDESTDLIALLNPVFDGSTKMDARVIRRGCDVR